MKLYYLLFGTGMEKEPARVYGLHTHITLRCVRALWKLLAQKECTDESVGEFIFLSPTLPFRSRRDLYILVTHVLRKGIIGKYVVVTICEGRASFVSRWVIQITRPLSFRSLFVLEIDMHLMVLDDFFQPSLSLYKQRAGWMTICTIYSAAAAPVMRKWHANELETFNVLSIHQLRTYPCLYLRGLSHTCALR